MGRVQPGSGQQGWPQTSHLLMPLDTTHTSHGKKEKPALAYRTMASYLKTDLFHLGNEQNTPAAPAHFLFCRVLNYSPGVV